MRCRAAMATVFAFALVLGGGVYGGEGAEPPPDDAQAAAQKANEAVFKLIDGIPAGALDEGVFLQSGDIKVTMTAVSRVESAYVAANKRQMPKFSLTGEHQRALRKAIAVQLLSNALLEKHVAEQKIEGAKENLDAEFVKFKQRYKDQGGSYEQFLADNGLTDEEFTRYWNARMALETKLGETVTDEEVNTFFDKRKNGLPLRRVSHILFMHKGGERAPATVTRTKDEARTAAEVAIKKLKEGGDFAKLAQETSDCPSKAKGGDLDFFPRKGAMVEQFSDAAYKLEKAGDYTAEPVETPFGYHVIKLTEMRDVNELKGNVRRHLSGQRVEKQIQQLLQGAAAKAKFNEKLLS